MAHGKLKILPVSLRLLVYQTSLGCIGGSLLIMLYVVINAPLQRSVNKAKLLIGAAMSSIQKLHSGLDYVFRNRRGKTRKCPILENKP